MSKAHERRPIVTKKAFEEPYDSDSEESRSSDSDSTSPDEEATVQSKKKVKKKKSSPARPQQPVKAARPGSTPPKHRTLLNESAMKLKDTITNDIAAVVKNWEKEWARSKLMIIGEGRAGKTALADSIAGVAFHDTPSTVGINQLTCDVKLAAVGQGHWSDYKRPEKELEYAVAQFIATDANKKELTRKQTRISQKAEMTNKIVTPGNSTPQSKNANPVPSSPNKMVTSITAAPPSRGSLSVRSPRALNMSSKSLQSEEKRDEQPSKSKTKPNMLISTTTNAASDTAATDTVDNNTEFTSVLPDENSFSASEVDSTLVMKCLVSKVQMQSDLILSIFDFGGQSVFDVIHHFFLTKCGVYLLVFNMRWLLGDTTSVQQCLSYLRGWLSSIVVHTSGSSSSMSSKDSAPVALIGTHKDYVNDTSDHSRISRLLNNAFSLHPAWCKILENDQTDLCFFPVNNKIGRNDPTVTSLMSTVEIAVLSSSYVHEKVPLTWLRCLDEMAADERSSLSLTDVFSIASRCGMSESNVPSLLRFLHQMGVLMWHEDEKLRDVVILNAVDYFITPATRVVCKHQSSLEDRSADCVHYLPIHKKCKKELPLDWQNMLDKGIVTTELLYRLLEEAANQREEVILLMKKFGLLIPLIPTGIGIDAELDLDVSSNDIRQYLVPALLPKYSSPSGKPWTDLSVSTFSLFFFTNNQLKEIEFLTPSYMRSLGFLPNGLFERLIGRAVQWAQLIGSGQRNLFLYKDFALLSNGGQRFRLRADFILHCIHVDVAGDPLPVLERIQNIVKSLIAECLKSLCVVCLLEYNDEQSHEGISSETSYIPLDAMHSAVKSHTGLNVYNGHYLNPSELSRLFFPWLRRSVESLSRFDVFLSYRWIDQISTHALYDRLSLYTIGSTFRAVDVFLDAAVLQFGNKLKEDFARSMFNSTVIVPMVSTGAIEKMINHDPSKEDNVLIEWMLVNLFYRASTSRIKKIFPLLLPGSETDDLVEECKQLPDTRPDACIRRVAALLSAMGLSHLIPSPAKMITVRSIVVDDLLEQYTWFDLKRCRNPHQPRYVVAESCQMIMDILRTCPQSGNEDETNNITSSRHKESHTSRGYSAQHSNQPHKSSNGKHSQIANLNIPLSPQDSRYLERSLDGAAFRQMAVEDAERANMFRKEKDQDSSDKSADTSTIKFVIHDYRLAYEILCNPRKVVDPERLQQILDDLGVTEAEELGDCDEEDILKIVQCLKPVMRGKFIKCVFPNRRKDCESAFKVLHDSDGMSDEERLRELIDSFGLMKAGDLELCSDDDVLQLADCLKKVAKTRFLCAVAR
mmetsp:Transcript_23591/g.23783  ORF Transcript_23591/g.23783 Transcript_23591/m.23783 type:complete len:1313 (+) Transcript_23591:119-4057(+)